MEPYERGAFLYGPIHVAAALRSGLGKPRKHEGEGASVVKVDLGGGGVDPRIVGSLRVKVEVVARRHAMVGAGHGRISPRATR